MKSVTAAPSFLLSGAAAVPFAGETTPLAPSAGFDRVLLTGTQPGGFDGAQQNALRALSVAAPVASAPRVDARWAAQFYSRPALAVGAASLATAAALSLPMPVAAAVTLAGAAAGVLIRRSARQGRYEGPVTVQVDDASRGAKWKEQPPNFSLSPAEMRQQLLGQGMLGDVIPDLPVDLHPGPLPPQPWDKTLADLDGQRRLVADAGIRSTYGHEVLSRVTAPQAKQLMADGRPVYVVNGTGCQDIPHVFQTTARSYDKKVADVHGLRFVEREFQYTLTPITDPDALARVPRAQGMPAGIEGVYARGGQVGQVVLRQEYAGNGVVQDDGASVVRAGWRNHADWTSTASAPLQEPVTVNLGRFKNWAGETTVFGFLAGAAAGMGLMAVAPNPVVALGMSALGAFAGRALGAHLDRRDASNQPVTVVGIAPGSK